MKILVKVVVILILVVVVALLAGFFYIDSLAKRGIEKGATYALGVPTTVDGVSIGLLSGQFSMNGLNVANPTGFDSGHFLNLNDGGVAVSLNTLRQDTVEMPRLELTGLDVNLEKKQGNANYKVILDNIKSLESGDKPKEDSGPGKNFVIREVVITDITATVDLLPIGGELSRMTVPIDEIRLTNVGSGEDQRVNLSKLADVLIKAILGAIIQNGNLPGDILGDLQGRLANLESLSDMGIGAVTEIGGKVTELTGSLNAATEDLRKSAEELGKGVGDATKGLEDLGKSAGDAAKGLGGLLGGNKDKDDDK